MLGNDAKFVFLTCKQQSPHDNKILEKEIPHALIEIQECKDKTTTKQS